MPAPVILCVDDEKSILDSLKEQLRVQLDNSYPIELAESGAEALTVIEELFEDEYELGVIISDQIMPGMKGNELLKTVHEISPDTLKILLTGHADADAVGDAVNRAQLYRYIAKPWEPTDLVMTVKEAMRRYLQDKKLAEQNVALQAVNKELEQLNANLEQKVEQRTAELERAYTRLKSLNQRMQSELRMAHDIQQSLLPPTQPAWDKLQVVCYNIPARELGGDFYVYHAFDGTTNPLTPHADTASTDRYVLAIGDVSGKGVSAALLMAASLAQFDASLTQSFDPAERLLYLDKAIEPYTKPRRYNCAMCYVELNLSGDSPTAAMINAGCIPPYIKRAADGQVEWPDLGGLALGLGLDMPHAYEPLVMPLYKGDIIILMSDGVVEATNAADEMLGFDRLEALIEAGPLAGAEAMLQYLKQAVADFTGEAEQRDDLTIIVVQI